MPSAFSAEKVPDSRKQRQKQNEIVASIPRNVTPGHENTMMKKQGFVVMCPGSEAHQEAEFFRVT